MSIRRTNLAVRHSLLVKVETVTRLVQLPFTSEIVTGWLCFLAVIPKYINLLA